MLVLEKWFFTGGSCKDMLCEGRVFNRIRGWSAFIKTNFWEEVYKRKVNGLLGLLK
jgi:hypothetical protein